MSVFERIKDRFAQRMLTRISRLEVSLNDGEGLVTATKSAREKQMPDRLEIPLKSFPKMLSIVQNMEQTVTSLRYNPIDPKDHCDEEFLTEFEHYARSFGVGVIRYTSIDPEYLFKERSVLYSHAIVLAIEMDKGIVDSSPSSQAHAMGIRTYDDLGKTTNALASYLRQHGYAAQASHPAGGFVVYPRIAQKAGVGWHGRHGLLISPEYGPRQRISVLFTSITNLPIHDSDEHSWIEGFCARCGNCIRSCPVNAILEVPVVHEGGWQTHIDQSKCIGCSMCLKTCSFNRRPYAALKEAYATNAGNETFEVLRDATEGVKRE